MKRKRTRKRKIKVMGRLKKSFITLATLVVVAVFAWFDGDLPLDLPSPYKGSSQGVDHTITFPADRYPETAKHIKDAIKAGHSDVCTIDRGGADANRELSLKGVPVKKGKDRDEWPMAMCAEGGANADIVYISPKDNRGAGSWVGNQLSTYPDGTRVKFVVK